MMTTLGWAVRVMPLVATTELCLSPYACFGAGGVCVSAWHSVDHFWKAARACVNGDYSCGH